MPHGLVKDASNKKISLEKLKVDNQNHYEQKKPEEN